ncbi:MAG: RT0821/Lpp0805 family surface protein [Alphaproteobacteria bacterium]
MKILKIAPVVIMAVALAACTPGREKEQIGAVTGAGLGALAGSQIGSGSGRLAAVAIGTLLGAWGGSEVGRQLDERDRLLASQAYEQANAAPVGQTITWNNPQSGHSGTVTPTRDGTNTQTGAYCREYQQTVTVGGKSQEAYGTACRQPDGTWKVVQ